MKKLILTLLLASSCSLGTAVFADDSDDVKVSESSETGTESGNETGGSEANGSENQE
ncbi:hypothetical protein [Chlamydia felis]|uniref:hypothetical protein n=1 Tax=Chlamydia felis TaxID=83556 RepID=UPI0002D74249|nr:hypothetical protein [Chlamydia felis]